MANSHSATYDTYTLHALMRSAAVDTHYFAVTLMARHCSRLLYLIPPKSLLIMDTRPLRLYISYEALCFLPGECLDVTSGKHPATLVWGGCS